MNVALILLIIVPLGTAIIIPLLDIFYKELRKYLIVFSTFLEFVILSYIVINNFNEITKGSIFLTYNLGGWLPPVGINLTFDMLSLYFAALISTAVLFSVIYSIGYIGHHEGKYYVLLFLMWAAMQGIILTSDIFNFYVFLELVLITSASLIAFKRNREGTEAAIKYMFYGIIGGLFIFIGIILIYFNLGTLNFAEISKNFRTLPMNNQLFISVFFLIGLFIKLGIFPFHFWVAKAQSAAPSPISALLSGVVEKIYIYAFLRLFWNVFNINILNETGLNQIIIYAALLSSIVGHILALYEDDLKRMLAYSTIGHLGIIVAVVTLNTKFAIMAGLLHVLSHMVMKISLFTSAGFILQFTPSHKLKDSRGVAHENITVFSGFIIAAAGMMGLPPMIGFFSKLFIVRSFIDSSFYLGASVVVLGSIFSFIYYSRYIKYGFKKISLGSPEEFRLILSVLYRERVVKDIALVFVIAVVLSGIFYKSIFGPLEGVFRVLENPSLYIDLILGG
ncbi:MAG: Na+/H+ antiporter subunit D [Halanaerobiales bacterium]|nr:Na+/H+ antiporter subunit D [Halanaerobiales bacterium]